MSRHRIVVVLAASLIALGCLALAVLAPPGRDRTGFAAPEPPSGCTTVVSKTALPGVIALGETVGVTLTARAICPDLPLHIVFVLDGSSNMVGTPGRKLQQAASGMVRSLDMRAHPGIRVGVVSFDTSARTLCPLTDDEGAVMGCIQRAGTSGEAAMETGIREGLRLLQRARSHVDLGLLTEIMIVISDGAGLSRCDVAAAAANQVKGDDILLVSISVCEGTCPGDGCMRSLATSSRYFFKGSSPTLWPLLPDIRDRFGPFLYRMVITDTVHPDVEYVAGSANPAPLRTLPGPAIQWSFYYPPRTGVTMSLRVRPLHAGLVSTNITATGVLTDMAARLAHWVFPLPKVSVLGPTAPPPPTPTPTTAPATPSATVTQAPPTPVPTDTPTLVPTDTPTPRPNPAFLPALRRATE